MRTLIIILILISAFNASFGQTKFRGEASLPKVEADGFYRILVSPALCTHLNSAFSNVRIYSDQNKEVPYLLQEEVPTYYTQVFKTYGIVEKTQQKNCCTKLVLQNPEGNAINNISLSIRNAEVTKRATLLGSDDRQNWFALKQKFVLSSIDNKNQTSEIKIVDFPLSNYTYYLLQIEDSTTAPLNILSAGYYEVNSENGKYTEVSSFLVTKSDSTQQKRSYISVKFDTTQFIDRFAISFSGAPYFLRKASLLTKKERVDKKGNKEIYFDWLCDLELSSKYLSVIEFSGLKVDELLFVIENRDNPPMEVASAKAYQLNRYLTAWLKKDESYMIKLGEPELQAPDYDIGYFKDSIPDQAHVLAVGDVSLFAKDKPQSTTFFTTRAFIWVAIVLVIVVLGFMTLRMVRETAKKE